MNLRTLRTSSQRDEGHLIGPSSSSGGPCRTATGQSRPGSSSVCSSKRNWRLSMNRHLTTELQVDAEGVFTTEAPRHGEDSAFQSTSVSQCLRGQHSTWTTVPMREFKFAHPLHEPQHTRTLVAARRAPPDWIQSQSRWVLSRCDRTVPPWFMVPMRFKIWKSGLSMNLVSPQRHRGTERTRRFIHSTSVSRCLCG